MPKITLNTQSYIKLLPFPSLVIIENPYP